MKIAVMAVCVACLAGCVSSRPDLAEFAQLNFPKGGPYSKPFRPPTRPLLAQLVVAKVLEVREYQGGIRSWDTWPHHHLILRIIKGTLPHSPSAMMFDYHTVDLQHQFVVGQFLTFVFDLSGNLWGLDGINPAVQPRLDLHWAAMQRNAKQIRLLLATGAEVNERGCYGLTALDLAGNDECRQLLRQAGGKTVEELDHWTPLHTAAWKGTAEGIRALLAAGADPKARADDGQTPLHLAARNGHADAIRLLLAAGADVKAKDKHGEIPLHSAARWGWAEAVRLLLAAGAKVNERTDGGQTAMDMPNTAYPPMVDRARSDKCRKLLRDAGGKTGAELDAEDAKPAQEPVKPPEPGR